MILKSSKLLRSSRIPTRHSKGQPCPSFSLSNLFNSFNLFNLLFLLLPTLSLAAPVPAIPTERHPVTNAYQGVTVTEDYQWLEDPSAPPVREWTHQQNDRTRSYFKSLPSRD